MASGTLRVFLRIWLLAAAAFSQTSGSGSDQAWQPFRAEARRVYVSDDGSKEVFQTLYARKADGSFACIKETSAYEGERGVVGHAGLAGESVWISTDSFTQTVITQPVKEREFQNLAEQIMGPACDQLETSGRKRTGATKEMLGLTVEEVENQITPRLKTRSWISPQLDCFPLQSTSTKDGVVSYTEEVSVLDRREPDRDLFSAPSDYVDVSPLEFEERWQQRYGGREYFGNSRALALELKYQDAKARRAREKR
jgi:hypothetical protein